MSEGEATAALHRRALDAFLVIRFVPGLEAEHDQFAFRQRDADLYAGVTVEKILTSLGAGWTTEDRPETKETVFRRHIGAREALEQIWNNMDSDEA